MFVSIAIPHAYGTRFGDPPARIGSPLVPQPTAAEGMAIMAKIVTVQDLRKVLENLDGRSAVKVLVHEEDGTHSVRPVRVVVGGGEVTILEMD